MNAGGAKSRNCGIDSGRTPGHHGRRDPEDPDALMAPEPWPPDRRTASERLSAMIHDIDGRDHTARQALLADFLRVAWPTWWAQDQ